jgi:HlyD family secretion protein
MRRLLQGGWCALLLTSLAGLILLPAGAQDKKGGKAARREAAAAAKSEADPDKKEKETVSHGKTHTVSRGPFKHQIELDASIAGAHTADVSIHPDDPLQLSIREITPHGTRVTKGQTLVKFDTTKLDDQIRDLESAKALAELSLKQARQEAELIAKTAPLDAELSAQSKKYAEEDLARFEKTDRAFREKSSDFNVKRVGNFLEYVEEELKQLEKMYKADDLTEETEEIVLKRARNDVEQMKFVLDLVKYENVQDKEVDIPRSLSHYQHSAAQAALLAERARVATPLVIEKEKLQAEKMQFEQKKTADQLERLKKDRDKLTVTAPADGVLYYGRWHGGKWTNALEVSQKLHEGAQIQPHDLAMTVVQPGPLEIQAAVPEKELARVATGISGQLSPKAWPDQKIAVKIEKISVAPQSEGEFRATLSLEGKPPEALVAGMTGKVKIVAYYKADAIAVPAKTVFRDDADDDKRYVLVVEKDGKPKRRDVTVGHATEKLAEITVGLSVGEKILLEKPDQDAAGESEAKE